MTVKELIERLIYAPYEDKAVIMIEGRDGHLGSQPNISIKGLRGGFDWDTGLTFIVPENRLIKRASDEPLELTRFLEDRFLDAMETALQVDGGLHVSMKGLAKTYAKHALMVIKSELSLESTPSSSVKESSL